MSPGLTSLIHNYQRAVCSAVLLLERAGIPRPESAMAWACLDIPQQGEVADGVKYFKHGYGCAVHLPSCTVDFDFGEQGQITGFDAWRLIGFAANGLSAYGFLSEQDLKNDFQASVDAGEILTSNYILCYLATADA